MLCKSGHARRVPDLMRVDFKGVDLERLNQPENAPLDQKLPEMESLQGVHCLRKNCLSITILSIKRHGYLSEICGGFCFQLVANLLKRPCSDKLKWVITRMVTIRQIYICVAFWVHRGGFIYRHCDTKRTSYIWRCPLSAMLHLTNEYKFCSLISEVVLDYPHSNSRRVFINYMMLCIHIKSLLHVLKLSTV